MFPFWLIVLLGGAYFLQVWKGYDRGHGDRPSDAYMVAVAIYLVLLVVILATIYFPIGPMGHFLTFA